MADRNLEVGFKIPFVEEIDLREIEKIGVVGKGTFGTVHKAKWRDIYVAVKCIEHQSDDFKIEVRQLSRVSHPNIIALYGACSQKPDICLVMEYAEGGSLYKLLHCNKQIPYSAGHAMSWARQCAEGVSYLHAMKPKPLIHRDLKPPNLLLIKGGTILKICDFGTVTDKSTLMTNNKGSAAWMAPEVFEGSSYTEKCDVFSWGIILWEVLTRQQPFQDVESTYGIMWAVHSGRRPPLIEDCPKPIEMLLTSCWDKAPVKRPGMKNVVDIMQSLCKFFPGGDEIIDYDYDKNDIEENSEGSYYYEEETEMYTNDDFNLMQQQQQQQSVNNPTSKVANIIENFSRQNIQNQNLNNPLNRPPKREIFFEPKNGGSDISRFAVLGNPGGLGLCGGNNSNYNRNEPNFINRNQQQHQTTDSDVYNANFIRPNGIMSGKTMTPLQLNIEDEMVITADDELQQLLGNLPSNAGRENVTVTEKVKPNPQETQEPPHDPDENDFLDFEAMQITIEEHLRPATPDPNSQESQIIFDEHKKMVQEYLKLQTDLTYITKHRDQILAEMDPEEKKVRLEYFQKLQEKQALEKLEENLKKQVNSIRVKNSMQQMQLRPQIQNNSSQTHQRSPGGGAVDENLSPKNQQNN